MSSIAEQIRKITNLDNYKALAIAEIDGKLYVVGGFKSVDIAHKFLSDFDESGRQFGGKTLYELTNAGAIKVTDLEKERSEDNEFYQENFKELFSDTSYWPVDALEISAYQLQEDTFVDDIENIVAEDGLIDILNEKGFETTKATNRGVKDPRFGEMVYVETYYKTFERADTITNGLRRDLTPYGTIWDIKVFYPENTNKTKVEFVIEKEEFIAGNKGEQPTKDPEDIIYLTLKQIGEDTTNWKAEVFDEGFKLYPVNGSIKSIAKRDEQEFLNLLKNKLDELFEKETGSSNTLIELNDEDENNIFYYIHESEI